MTLICATRRTRMPQNERSLFFGMEGRVKRSGLKNRQKPLERKTPLRARKWWRPKRKKKRSDYVTEVWVLTFQHIGPMPSTYVRWSIDHIIPISYGRSKGIPPELIGSKENLRWVPLNDNIQKGTRIFTDEQFALLEQWGFPTSRPSDLTRTINDGEEQ